MNHFQRTISTGLDMFCEGMGTVLWQAIAAAFVVGLGLFTLVLRAVRGRMSR